MPNCSKCATSILNKSTGSVLNGLFFVWGLFATLLNVGCSDGTTGGCNGSSTQSCTITNGTGIQNRTCDGGGTWSAWGTCAVVSCNDGYVVSNSTCVAATYLRTFYVSNNGSDTADGTSSATAWETISKVNSHTFLPGDAILFERGGLWREALIIPGSGNATYYITFGNYGSAVDKPKLYGSNISASWAETSSGSHIWKSSTSFSVDPFSGGTTESEIFFENVDGSISWGSHKTSTSALAAEYDWTWSANYIYVYADSNPSSKYLSVEIPQRNYVINVGDTNEYIALDGLDIRYAISINVDDRDPPSSLTGFSIRNCHVGYVGSREQRTGYNLAVLRNNLLIQNNEIHEGGRRIVSIHAYDAYNTTFSNIVIEGNYLHDGYHGSGIGINMDGTNYYGDTFQDIIVRNNIFRDNPDRDPAVDGFDATEQCTFRVEQPGATIKNIQVYGNLFLTPNGDGLLIQNVSNVTVYNNTFYDFNHHSTTSWGGGIQLWIVDDCKNVDIKNNIFYGTGTFSSTFYYNSIFLESGLSSEISVDYNLFYETDPLMRIVNVYGGDDKYCVSCPYKSWSQLPTDYGWQVHDLGIVNPLISTTNNYHLEAGSPAINAGTDVGLPYLGTAPDMGAYESSY